MSFLQQHSIQIGQTLATPFLNKNDIYQDGTAPMYRDVDGKLWAMSGHSHMGHIGMFCGTSLDDLAEVYPISTNFCVGHADYAYSGIRYPDGVKARGSIWPFGLYICPVTHRFFCFFHNESAWNGKGTGYDALGQYDEPHYDSDFRHVGLMHSDDEGRNWTFDRWVLTGNDVCFCEKYNPGAGNIPGQKEGIVSLGDGDFSIFIEPEGEYIYIFYNIVRVDTDRSNWQRCDTYVARTRKRTDGVMGDFVKYYNGAFCEAGNFGRETMIAENEWHPSVLWLKKYGVYMMAACRVHPYVPEGQNWIDEVTHLRFSTDLVNWSEPVVLCHEGEPFGNHYVTVVSHDEVNQPNVAVGDDFSILLNHNGTDVTRHLAKILDK